MNKASGADGISDELFKILKDAAAKVLRNLYGGQEATVKTGHGTIKWFQIGKGLCQGYML